MLTSRQRILNALTYKGCDRLPTFYQATPEFDAESSSISADSAPRPALWPPRRSTTRWTTCSAST